MDRRHHGQQPESIDEELARQTPRFHEKLGFVFEIVQVVPASVMPGPPPPPLVLTEMDNIDLATKPPNKPPPGAVKPGSPIMPPFLGQLPPIKIEGHNITHLSLDMATHGFTGRLRFRMSDTKLLGDVKDKDKVAKAFSSQNILMLKLCLRPEYSDVRGLAPLTPEMVPQIVSTVPIPVVPPVNPSVQLELAQLRMLPQEIQLELQQKRLLLQQQLLQIQQTLLTLQQQASALSQQLQIVTQTPQTPESLELATLQIQAELEENTKQTQQLLVNQQTIIKELSKPIPVPDVSAQLAALSSVAPPGVLPPKEQPIITPTPDVVGIPQLLEPGISPNGPLVPIEMLLTAVVTSHTVAQHTSYQANDLIVSVREYSIEFCDPAQALWKEHFPIALYTASSVADVIKKNSNLLINIKVKSSVLSLRQDQIFLSLNKDQRVSERASFYDWLIWRLDETGHALTYDYSQNIYLVQERAKRPKPFQVFARDIQKIITTQTLGRFYQETLMNDSARIATTQPILNLLALSPLRQDRWFHTPVPTEFALEYTKRLAAFSQPTPGFLLYFKRFPSRPFPPGVGLDFHLDPLDFPNHKFVIPKAAKKTNRVARMVFSADTEETDVLPRFAAKSTGMFHCSLAVWLQAGRDTEAKLPSYTRPQYPMEVEGIIQTILGLPGTQMWQNETDLLTGQQYYTVQLPVFGCQQVKTPFIPNYQPGQYFFPAYRKERVLIGLYYDRAEILRYLDWRPMAPLPAEVQGNQLLIGQDFTNGASHTLVYEKDVPEYIIKRQRYSSIQFIRMYQSGIEQKSIPMVSPKVDLAIQRATLATSQALEINCLGAPPVAGAAAGGGGAGGQSGGAAKAVAVAPGPTAKSGAGSGARSRVRQTGAQRSPKTVAPVAATNVRRVAAKTPADVLVDARGAHTDAKDVVSFRQTTRSHSPKIDARSPQIRMRRDATEERVDSDVDVLVAEAPRGSESAKPKHGSGSGSGTGGQRKRSDPGDHRGAKPSGPRGDGSGHDDSPRPGSPTSAEKEIPAHCRFGLDSGTGAALEVSCPTHDAKHAILVGQKGITIETESGMAKASIEQHGDTIAIKCRELTIDVDQLRVRSQTNSSFQSLGQMTLSSLANLSIQTPSGVNLTAMNGVTINALTVLINALKTIRLLGITGGVGTFGAGPGVHAYGSEVSTTGLTNTVAGVNTYVHGTSVQVGPDPSGSGTSDPTQAIPESDVGAAEGISGSDGGHLAASLLSQFLNPKGTPQERSPSVQHASTEQPHLRSSTEARPGSDQASARAKDAPPSAAGSNAFGYSPPPSAPVTSAPRSSSHPAPPPAIPPARGPAVRSPQTPWSASTTADAQSLKSTVASLTSDVEGAIGRLGPSLFGSTKKGGPVVGQSPGHVGQVAEVVAQIESMMARAAVGGVAASADSAEKETPTDSAGSSFRGLLQRGAPGQSPYVVMRRLISLFAHMTWEGQTPIDMQHTFASAASAAPRPLAELQELLRQFQVQHELGASASASATETGTDNEKPPAQLLNALQEYLADLGSSMGSTMPSPAPSPSAPIAPNPDTTQSAPPPTHVMEETAPPSPSVGTTGVVQVPGLEQAQIEALLEAVHRDEVGAVLAETPEMIPQILGAALAAKAGGLRGDLSAPLLVIAESVLEARPDVSVLLALAGVAARAGLLPPRVAVHAVAGYQLASVSCIEVADLRAQLLQKEATGAERLGIPKGAEPIQDKIRPLVDLAAAAAESGLLPRSSATTFSENPAAALARLPEMIAVTEIFATAERILGGRPAPPERLGPLYQLRSGPPPSSSREIPRPSFGSAPAVAPPAFSQATSANPSEEEVEQLFGQIEQWTQTDRSLSSPPSKDDSGTELLKSAADKALFELSQSLGALQDSKQAGSVPDWMDRLSWAMAAYLLLLRGQTTGIQKLQGLTVQTLRSAIDSALQRPDVATLIRSIKKLRDTNSAQQLPTSLLDVILTICGRFVSHVEAQRDAITTQSTPLRPADSQPMEISASPLPTQWQESALQWLQRMSEKLASLASAYGSAQDRK